MDLDGSGAIESGREVFSPFFAGGGFAHALEALATLDSNGDGVLDSTDTQYADLRVWVDANSDGVTQAGELLSLTELGITSFNLGTVAGSGAIDGQNVLANGTFTYANGTTGEYSAVELSETSNTMMFVGHGSEDVVGTDAGDLLYAGGLGNALYGAGGNDTLYSGAGDDTLSGGGGNDRFVLANAGVDTISDYAAGDTIDVTSLLTVASGTDVIADGYLRVTTTGLVQVDLDGGGDNWVTVANVNVGASSYSIAYVAGDTMITVSVAPVAPPIGIDMDGDGQVSFVGAGAGASFDYGYGTVATAWVANNDGILVRDANHDGQASANEVVFATSGSDLQGLGVYDTNHDGQLSAADAAFGDFAVWQDANSNGVVDSGEMSSLMALGIASISLTSDGIGYSAAGGDVSVVGTGSFTRIDGSTGVLADAVFATGGVAQQAPNRAAANYNNAALVGAIAAAGLAANEPVAAAPVRADHGSADHPAAGGSQASAEPNTLATIAVEKLETAEYLADSGLNDGPTPGVAMGHADTFELQDQHEPASNQALEPLLQGSEAPVHEQIVSSTVLAPAVAVPSAVDLAASVPGPGGSQHNQLVGAVLADALQGIAPGAPDIDALLGGLPNHGVPSSVDALALVSHSTMSGQAAALFEFGMPHVPLEMVHHDALPPA
jgi:hypothetical protein